jgi:hypothetical protein
MSAIGEHSQGMATMLALSIPGFPSTIQIPFPNGMLPVCAICKNGFKSKAICRETKGHTDLPWSDTYVCITLDDTCFYQGSLKSNVQLTVEVNERRNDLSFIDGVDTKTPACVACKETKKQSTFCREMLSHRMLPYCTSYVTLKDTSISWGDLETGDEESGKPVKTRKVEHPSTCSTGVRHVLAAKACDITDSGMKMDGMLVDDHSSGLRFFDNMHDSRSFLCIVSATKWSIEVSFDL